jgi:PhnB protein
MLETMSVVPSGYTTVAPWVVPDDTPALLAFIEKSSGGVELAQVGLEDGSVGHAEIRVGDTVVLAFDRRDGWPQMPSLLRVFVPEVDTATVAALEAGASLVTPPLTQGFVQRGSRVRDPFGNIWWITAIVEDVAPALVLRRLSEPVYAGAMRAAQESLDLALCDRHTGAASRLSPFDFDDGTRLDWSGLTPCGPPSRPVCETVRIQACQRVAPARRGLPGPR